MSIRPALLVLLALAALTLRPAAADDPVLDPMGTISNESGVLKAWISRYEGYAYVALAFSEPAETHHAVHDEKASSVLFNRDKWRTFLMYVGRAVDLWDSAPPGRMTRVASLAGLGQEATTIAIHVSRVTSETRLVLEISDPRHSGHYRVTLDAAECRKFNTIADKVNRTLW